MPLPTDPPALAARPNSPISESQATRPATMSTVRGRGAFGHSSHALRAIAAATGTNQALPKRATMPSRIPPRIMPAWLRIASNPSSAASIRRTPRISRTWRVVRRGRAARLLRLEREEEARRAPDRVELRDVVRRMLRALEPIGFYLIRAAYSPAWRSIHSRKRRSDTGTSSTSAEPATCSPGRSGSRCATSRSSTARGGAGCSGLKTESGIDGRTNAGCKPIPRAALSAPRAVTTTWAGTASAWNADSGLIDSPQAPPPPCAQRAAPMNGEDPFLVVDLCLRDSVCQACCYRKQRGQEPQPPPKGTLLSPHQLVPAETAVAVEWAGDAAAARDANPRTWRCSRGRPCVRRPSVALKARARSPHVRSGQGRRELCPCRGRASE